jgi:regulator of replication initiation timing
MTLGSGIDGDAGDFDLRRVVAALVDRCGRLAGENEELKVENESLRDEIKRLKGLPPRPKFKPKPSGMEKSTQPEAAKGLLSGGKAIDKQCPPHFE